MSARKIIIEHNPYRTLVLVVVDGIVVHSTAGSPGDEEPGGGYIGMDEAEARCAIGSVMRYKVGDEGGADGYSSTTNVPLPPVSPEEEP